MNNTKIFKTLITFFAVVLCFDPVGLAEPVGTAFTYQGRLIDANQAAGGLYDFQFKLFDSESDGNQLGADDNKLEVKVFDGYFTVELDFGGVFDGNDRWLEIGVRPGDQNDPNAYSLLSPRQKVTQTPYALYAKSGTPGPQGPQGPPGESSWQMMMGGWDIDYDAPGNVGIGTTSPDEKFTVNGGTIKAANSLPAGKAIYGMASNTGKSINYGGYFSAAGAYGRGIYAQGGPSGYAAELVGDVNITGTLTARTKGTATVLVAASDAPADVKAIADFVCTGTADQLTIEAAYAALPTYYGGELHFSVGTFNCNNTININDDNRPCDLVGSGFHNHWPDDGDFTPAGTTIKLANNTNKRLLNYGYNFAENRACRWADSQIKYIWFDGNRAYNATPVDNYAITVITKGDTKIEFCMFRYFAHNVVLLVDNHGSWIDKCEFEDNSGRAVLLDAYRNWIINSYFRANSQNGLNNSAWETVMVGGNDNQYQTCINSCIFTDCYGMAIGVNPYVTSNYDMTITNCQFIKWGVMIADEAAIRLGNADVNIIISDNIFNGNGGRGIYGGILTRGVIKENIFSNTVSGKPIYFSGTLNNCVIKDNVGAEETLSATDNALPFETTYLSGTAAGQTITLPDGSRVQQEKTFSMTNASNAMTVSVTHHAAGNPKIFTFDDVNDFLQLVWNGRQWITAVNCGVAEP